LSLSARACPPLLCGVSSTYAVLSGVKIDKRACWL
jgi:hypothetical protein